MKKNKPKASGSATGQLRSADRHPFGALDRFVPMGDGESALYEAMRDAIPLLDAAIGKLVRLCGGFTVTCADKTAERELNRFLASVPCGRGQEGIACFLAAYLDSLLTYGRAVGELVVWEGKLRAVCWGDVRTIHIRDGGNPLATELCAYRDGELRPLPYPELLLFSTLHPSATHPYGVSLLNSMPFLCDVLLKIYHTIGLNWQRAGNVRYSVVYKPTGSEQDGLAAQSRAEEMASAWSRAMEDAKSGAVRDFVAVGDVEIKVIGADGKILDSEIPVRQILEQLVAKTGLPPFLLGLSWSTSERMSKQQADLLTSELWAIRRAVEPMLRRICRTWLRLEGYGGEGEILWDEISLQDTVEEAQAALYRAQRAQIEEELHGNS